MSSLERRITRLEAWSDLPPEDGGGPRLILIRGGPAALDRLHAACGDNRLDADPGEGIEAFKERALAWATAIGAATVIVSGSPAQ
jgi:hypothetical protein